MRSNSTWSKFGCGKFRASMSTKKRPLSADGRHGSLHAKVAIADGRVMLISSANLTEYAMTLNMELGVMMYGGPLPAQVEAHLGRLAEQGVFRGV